MAFDTKLTKLEGNIDYEKLKKKFANTVVPQQYNFVSLGNTVKFLLQLNKHIMKYSVKQ